MNFFKRNLPGYTLLELMVTISISAFLLTLCYTIHQEWHRKNRSYKHYFEAKKECLDFFTKISPFVHKSLQFTQKDARTLVLNLAPNAKNAPERSLNIQLNGKFHNKNTLNIPTRHIQGFSVAYWNSEQNEWIAFEFGEPYSSLSFIKIILWGKSRKILDTYVFPCYLTQERIAYKPPTK